MESMRCDDAMQHLTVTVLATPEDTRPVQYGSRTFYGSIVRACGWGKLGCLACTGSCEKARLSRYVCKAIGDHVLAAGDVLWDLQAAGCGTAAAGEADGEHR